MFATIVVVLSVAVPICAAASVAARKRRERRAAEEYDYAYVASQLAGLAERVRVMNSPLYDLHQKGEPGGIGMSEPRRWRWMCGNCRRTEEKANPIIQGVPTICVCGGLFHAMEPPGESPDRAAPSRNRPAAKRPDS